LWSVGLREPDTSLRLEQGRAQARGLVPVDGKGVGIWVPVRGPGRASAYSSGYSKVNQKMGGRQGPPVWRFRCVVSLVIVL